MIMTICKVMAAKGAIVYAALSMTAPPCVKGIESTVDKMVNNNNSMLI